MMLRFIQILMIALTTLTTQWAYAQTNIKGEVRDMANNSLMENVNIKNIYTQQGLTVQSDGQFTIPVKKGELIEFTKVGYQTVRVRILSEKEPEFYKIIMNKENTILKYY